MLLLSAFTVLTASLGVLLWVTRSRTMQRVPQVALEHRPGVDTVLRQARRRIHLCLAVGTVTFGLMLWFGWAAPVFIGLPYALAPGLAAVAGLIAFSVVPSPKPPRVERRVADVVARRPWSFGPRWSFAVPLVTATAISGVLLLTGLLSGDEDSPSFSLFGWVFAIPLITVIVLVSGAILLALARIANAPALPDPDLAPLDRHWREVSTGVVTKLAMSALLGTAGIAAYVAGAFLQGVLTMFVGDNDSLTSSSMWVTTVGEQIVGLVLAITAIAFWVLAVIDAFSLRAPRRRVAVLIAPGAR